MTDTATTRVPAPEQTLTPAFGTSSGAWAVLVVSGDEFSFGAAHAGYHPDGLEPLHGHTYTVRLEVGGHLDQLGMVKDFGLLKQALRETIAPLKRRTLVATHSAVMPVTVEDARVRFGIGLDRYDLPEHAVCLLPINSTSTEALALHLLSEFLRRLGHDAMIDTAPGQDRNREGLAFVQLTLAESPGLAATARAHLLQEVR